MLQEYIDSNILIDKKLYEWNRFNILKCKNFDKGRTGIKCDSTVGSHFDKLRIASITVEPDHCDSTRKFTLLLFNLSFKSFTQSFDLGYYYCSEKNKLIETRSYRDVPLDTHWFLHIENN